MEAKENGSVPKLERVRHTAGWVGEVLKRENRNGLRMALIRSILDGYEGWFDERVLSTIEPDQDRKDQLLHGIYVGMVERRIRQGRDVSWINDQEMVERLRLKLDEEPDPLPEVVDLPSPERVVEEVLGIRNERQYK